MDDIELTEAQLEDAVKLYVKTNFTNHPVVDITIIGGRDEVVGAIVEFKKEKREILPHTIINPVTKTVWTNVMDGYKKG